MGFFDLNGFLEKLRDLKDDIVKPDSATQILEVSMMKYESDRDEAYERLKKETEKKVNIVVSILIGCLLAYVLLYNLRYMYVIDQMLKFDILLFACSATGGGILAYGWHRELQDFVYTNRYSNYIITDDWYLDIISNKMFIQGENIEFNGKYVLGVGNDEYEFEITQEQYRALDDLDDMEVIAIDMLKTRSLDGDVKVRDDYDSDK